MADYYPLIARAVAGLDKNTGENRRALYERARTALVNQLRGAEPALEESDITRERLALEEAIRRLESEAAKRANAPDADDQRHSLRDQGLRDFRDTVAEAEVLGDAAAEASRSARATYDESHGEHPPPHGIAEGGGDSATGEHYFEPPAAEQFEPEPQSELPPMQEVRPADEHEHSFEPPASEWSAPPPAALHEHEDDIYTRPARSYGRIVKVVLLLLVIGGIAGAGYWQRNTIMSTITTTIASLRAPPPAPAPKPKEATEPASRPKIADRIGAPNNSSEKPATAPAGAVAQKVVLYDEDPSDPKGKRYVGSAIWRTETVSPGPGLAPELAIRADVEIPERRMRMTWSLRRNTDKALPASHTIEIMFTLPADFTEGGIGNVPGVLMKQNEGARGVPLAGLAVKVTNGYFLIGLSAVGIDMQRNIQLLKERDWFDIPVVYTSGKRAILAIEKGTPGVRAFEEAFRAWGQ
jgi:hypothetical protein